MRIVVDPDHRKRHERLRMVRLDAKQLVQKYRGAKEIAGGAPLLRRVQQKIEMSG